MLKAQICALVCHIVVGMAKEIKKLELLYADTCSEEEWGGEGNKET